MVLDSAEPFGGSIKYLWRASSKGKGHPFCLFSFACDPSLLPDLTMQSPTDIAKDLALGPCFSSSPNDHSNILHLS